MALIVKRENWKGKYYVVAREKGKIRSRIKYSKKVKIQTLRKKFSTDKTLRKGLSVEKLTNFREFVDKDLRKPRGVKFRVVASIFIEDEWVRASSNQAFWRSVQEAKRQALERLYMRVHQSVMGFGNYDEDEGEILVNKLASRPPKFEVVYYRK